ncbi:hypothetical protein [Derxia gummosa]|uniref:Uncharacterized protein n=1 Tax=Derxia gummosa DSM 723 TaxID=1121388 RepID=A0A8B6X2S0_9BURK|nr:hypothetical protein [Derxia gummosa]
MSAVLAQEPALFEHTADALTWAYRQEGAHPEVSAATKAGRGTAHVGGRGLGPTIEGSGNAGLIKAEVMRLGEVPGLVIAARFSLRALPCGCGAPCCKHTRPSPVWTAATRELARMAADHAPGTAGYLRLRVACVERFFGVKESFIDVARRNQLAERTVSTHNKAIATWLKSEEGRAMHALDFRLREAGIVGDR